MDVLIILIMTIILKYTSVSNEYTVHLKITYIIQYKMYLNQKNPNKFSLIISLDLLPSLFIRTHWNATETGGGICIIITVWRGVYTLLFPPGKGGNLLNLPNLIYRQQHVACYFIFILRFALISAENKGISNICKTKLQKSSIVT